MIPTAVLTKLATLGLSEVQAEAVAGMLSAVEAATQSGADAVIEKSRERVRARVQKWRAKQPVTLPNVTERYVTAHAGATKKENKEDKKESKERASRLPKDWVLPCAWFDEAEAAGLPASRVDAEARKMHNWSLSDRNGAKLDWHATWRNWFQRALESLTKATGPPKPPTLATMWRDEARNLGILNDPASQPNRRVEARFASGDNSMPGLARRIASAGG